MSDKIIPINRAFIRSLEDILKTCGLRCHAPEKYNAIFIDRKGFIKQDTVNKFQTHIRFAVPPRMGFASSAPDSMSVTIEECVFMFYRQIGSTLEYREV